MAALVPLLASLPLDLSVLDERVSKALHAAEAALLSAATAYLSTDRIEVKVAEAITLHKLQGFGDTALTDQPDRRLELRGSRTITAAVTTKSVAQVTLPARDERRTVTQFPKLQATLNRPMKILESSKF